VQEADCSQKVTAGYSQGAVPKGAINFHSQTLRRKNEPQITLKPTSLINLCEKNKTRQT